MADLSISDLISRAAEGEGIPEDATFELASTFEMEGISSVRLLANMTKEEVEEILKEKRPLLKSFGRCVFSEAVQAAEAAKSTGEKNVKGSELVQLLIASKDAEKARKIAEFKSKP